jgi:hypothetical protein
MQRCGAADGPTGVSPDSRADKPKRGSPGSVDVIDETAGVGAEEPRCRRRLGRRPLPQPDNLGNAAALRSTPPLV